MMRSQPLKPNWNALVVKPMISTIGFGFLLSLVVGFFLPQYFLVPFGFFLFLAGIQFILNRKRYEKTEYYFEDEKIRARSGGYFSDSETELLWSKIVQPRLGQNYIQKLIFGTGNIALDTAGEMGAEVALVEIENFEDVFGEILDRLDEDVSLTDDELQNEYEPAGGGKVLDFAFPLVTLLVVAAGFLYGLNFVAGLGSVAGLSGNLISTYAPYVIVGLVLLFLPTSLYGFLKQSNTTYQFYNNYAVLNVDFLGITRKVIPLSELSDVNLDQPISKRLIGLSNLGLSVPGMGDAFVLRNIADADAIRENIKQRVRGRGEDEGTPSEDARRYDARPDFTATAGPAMLFTCLGLLVTLGLMTFLPTTSDNYLAIGILATPTVLPALYLLYKWILYSSVGFAVEGDRVEYDFAFLSRDVTSLSTDKIKAIVKSQGILQRLFGVYTVTFNSIGTEDDVDFFNVKDTDENEEMIRSIREREGSYGGEKQESITPEFSFSGMIFQNPISLFASVVFAFLPAALAGLILHEVFVGFGTALLAGFGIGVVLTALFGMGFAAFLNFYYSNYVSLDLFDDYLVYRDGFFNITERYVIYNDIRNVEYSEQPFGSVGWLTIDFAGGGVPDDDENVSLGKFSIPHLTDVNQMARNLENIFAGKLDSARVRADREEHDIDYSDELKQSIKPSPVPYILQGMFYALLVPVFLMDDLSLGMMMYGGMALAPLGAVGGFIYPKTISYSIKENQVERSQWILITRTKSVKYQNIDNIDQNRGITDKIFGTGRVDVSTTGGGGVELKASYIRDYDSFYENLQAEYNEARTDDQ